MTVAAGFAAAKGFNAAIEALEKRMSGPKDKWDGAKATFSAEYASKTPSVSRIARDSIVYFPLVISESVPAAMLKPLAAAVLARVAEYVRIYVTNWDAIALKSGESKKALIDRIRGVRMENAAGEPMTQADADEVSADLVANWQRYIDEALDATGSLMPPLERLAEAGEEGEEEEPEDGKTSDWGRAGARPGGERKADGGARNPDDAYDTDYDGAKKAKSDDEFRQKMQAVIERLDRLDPATAVRYIKRLVARAPKGSREAAALKVVLSTIEAGIKQGKELDTKALLGLRSSFTSSAEQAKSSDVSKLNAAQPLLLKLVVNYVSDGGADSVELLIGVKVVSHVAPAMDLVAGVGESMAQDSLILRYVRWSTGEISFLKGFLLDMDAARDRVSPHRGSGRRILDALARIAKASSRARSTTWSKLAKAVSWIPGFKQAVQVPPTATIVLSMSDVESIRAAYGVNLASSGAARAFMDKHGLMGLQIVDDAAQVVLTYEDGDGGFDRVPVSELVAKTREGAQSDIIANVLSAVGRR